MLSQSPEVDPSETVSRRHFLALIWAGALAGCEQNPLMPASVDTIRFAWKGAPGPPITRAQVAEMPYATLYARFGKAPPSVLVLGRYAGEDLHWISADRGVLVTRHGRLVRTVGFQKNLLATRGIGTDPIAAGLHQLAGDGAFTRLVDIGPGNHFQVPVSSRMERVQDETIEILELRFSTVQVREHCTSETLRWEFVNHYWADQRTGFIWKSIQHVVPDLPPFELEVLKPASRK